MQERWERRSGALGQRRCVRMRADARDANRKRSRRAARTDGDKGAAPLALHHTIIFNEENLKHCFGVQYPDLLNMSVTCRCCTIFNVLL